MNESVHPHAFKRIETERLLIRAMQPADALPLATLWSDPDVTAYMGGPRDFIQLRDDLERDAYAQDETTLDLWPVIHKETERVIGHCGLVEKNIDDQAEIELVYVLARQAWGKGYATEAASALRDYAFWQLDLRRLVALIDPENVASARVAEKVGMRFEKETQRPGGKWMHVYVVETADAHDG